MKSTPLSEIPALVRAVHEGRADARKSDLRARLSLLDRFEKALMDSREELIAAVARDFAKPRFEAIMSELFPVKEELKLIRSELADWMSDQKVPGSPFFPGASTFVRHEGKGAVLIIAPWNYPIALALVPMVGALAAGNTVLLKPSELTPATSQALADFCARTFPENLVRVVQGGVAETEELLKHPFDHIFFTGSTSVGRVIMRAAAEHLTPVTLELGGKSPVIIAEDADLAWAAESLIWGKGLNAGQTCVAPDFIFAPESRVAQLTRELEAARARRQPRLDDQPQIVTERHADRLKQMANEVGAPDPSADPRRVTLQFPVKPSSDSKMMREEIFGPLMPILTYGDLEEVFSRLGREPRPLALYIYAKSRSTQERILANTWSGGVCINDTILHLGNHHLPFGGTGPSGMGNYHGIASLRTFSHERAVFRQGPVKMLSRLVRPPYTQGRTRLMEKILRWM